MTDQANNSSIADATKAEEMTEEQLNGITGGGRTNGDNPIVQTVIMAAKETFYKDMWYSSQGWKS